jgi:hypothetical protein
MLNCKLRKCKENSSVIDISEKSQIPPMEIGVHDGKKNPVRKNLTG